MPVQASLSAGGTVFGSRQQSIPYFAFSQGTSVRLFLTEYSGTAAHAIVQAGGADVAEILALLIGGAHGH